MSKAAPPRGFRACDVHSHPDRAAHVQAVRDGHGSMMPYPVPAHCDGKLVFAKRPGRSAPQGAAHFCRFTSRSMSISRLPQVLSIPRIGAFSTTRRQCRAAALGS